MSLSNRTLHTQTLTLLILLAILSPLYLLESLAYIPAVAVNDTSGLNLSDSSSIELRWNPNGVYSGEVSYQLQADIPTGGVDLGALVHFSEDGQGPNVTTSTPWIAMISCDTNGTSYSDFWDIFTLARDRGAVAALLYTLTAESCLINQNYIQNFEKPVDVFATKKASIAALIESQFVNTNNTFYSYNQSLLTQYGTIVNQSLAADTVPTRTFLIATMTARNSTGNAEPQPTGGSTSTATPQKSGSTGKSLAMIILYSITGVVTTLFVIVVLTGAIRALRHPERYGPRADGNDGYGDNRPQTTAHGIGQAILDTFPVIKFSRKAPKGQNGRLPTAYPTYDKDPDSEYLGLGTVTTLGNEYAGTTNAPTLVTPPNEHEDASTDMGHSNKPVRNRDSTGYEPSEHESYHSAQEVVLPGSRNSQDGEHSPNAPGPEIAAAAKALAAHRTSITSASGSAKRSSTLKATDGKGEYDTMEGVAEGDEGGDEEICPICLLEFETGDDVRVLPCEQAHSYHKSCIDPWLLEVSSSCPLCRRDFSAPLSSSNQAESSAAGARSRAASDTTRNRPPLLAATSSQSPLIPSVDTPGVSGTNQQTGRAAFGMRFGRYLAFVRKEKRRSHGQEAGVVGDVGVDSGMLDSPTNWERETPVQRRRRERGEQTGPGPF